MGLFHKLRAWWGTDSDERREEAVTGTEADRDEAGKDYESFKDDQSIGGSYIGGPGIGSDFERDSKRPDDYNR